MTTQDLDHFGRPVHSAGFEKRIRATKTFWRYTLAENFGGQGSYTVEVDATITNNVLDGFKFIVRVYSMAAYNGEFDLSGKLMLSVGYTAEFLDWGRLYVTKSSMNWIECRCFCAFYLLHPPVFHPGPPVSYGSAERVRARIEVNPIVVVGRDNVPLGSGTMDIVLQEQFPPRPVP